MVIETTDIDSGSASQQEIGNRHSLGLVQRLLTISAASVDQRSVGIDKGSQLVEPAETSGDIRRQSRPMRKQKSSGAIVRVVEHGVGAVLPVALEVHVRAGIDQHRQHRLVLRGDVRRPLAEVEHGIVDSLPHVRRCEELLRARDVSRANGVAERLDVAFLEVGYQLRPRREAGFPGDRKLGVGKRKRAQGSRRRAYRVDAGERRRVTGARGADQILGKLALVFDAGTKGEQGWRGHGRPPSSRARVRIMG